MSINFDFKPGKFVHGDADKKIKIHHFDYGDIYIHIKKYDAEIREELRKRKRISPHLFHSSI